MPKNSPSPAPTAQRKECSAFLPRENSIPHTNNPAPEQAPSRVPKNGIGNRNVPSTAPVTAPKSAATEPGQLAPDFLAPIIPDENSTSSPRAAKIAIAINV